MKRWSTVLFAVISTMCVSAAVVIMIFAFNPLNNDRGSMFPVLPGIGAVIPTSGMIGEITPNESLIYASVSRETVRSVVETLSRPENYLKKIKVQDFWETGSAEYYISIYMLPTKTKLIIEQFGRKKRHIIITDDKIYSWQEGSSKFYEGKRWKGESRIETVDSFQRIPTYEDILWMNRNDINDAQYAEYGGKQYVLVDLVDDISGYLLKYYISIESELLERVETYDGSRLVQLITPVTFEHSPPDDDIFILPNGNVA